MSLFFVASRGLRRRDLQWLLQHSFFCDFACYSLIQSMLHSCNNEQCGTAVKGLDPGLWRAWVQRLSHPLSMWLRQSPFFLFVPETLIVEQKPNFLSRPWFPNCSTCWSFWDGCAPWYVSWSSSIRICISAFVSGTWGTLMLQPGDFVLKTYVLGVVVSVKRADTWEVSRSTVLAYPLVRSQGFRSSWWCFRPSLIAVSRSGEPVARGIPGSHVAVNGSASLRLWIS